MIVAPIVGSWAIRDLRRGVVNCDVHARLGSYERCVGDQ